MGKYVDDFNHKIETVDKADYHREQYQSFMTGPEWRNVEMAREYAAFLKEKRSMFQFPYFRQIADLWRTTFNSYKAARKYNSISSILFSEYMLMDVFVSFFTTMELLPKAILSLLLYPFLKKENDTPFQTALAESYQEYADNLETIPFYDHKYKEISEKLAQVYNENKPHTWVDWFTWKCVSFELWAKRWISKPLSYWYHQDDNIVPATTDFLVKFDCLECDDPELAREEFQDIIEAMKEDHPQLEIINLDIKDKTWNQDRPIREERQVEKDYISVYARLRGPRYAAFQPLMRELGEYGINLRKIAGQDRVQVKCQIKAKDEETLEIRQEELNKTKKVTPLYHYGDHIHSNHRICLFDVPVRNLNKTLDRLDKTEDVEISFIHNF